MPIYEVKCTKCGAIEDDVWLKVEEEPNLCECGGKRIKLCGGYFKLVYDNKKDVCTWGNEGYSSSMYWKDVKKARSEGKKVKAINEE